MCVILIGNQGSNAINGLFDTSEQDKFTHFRNNTCLQQAHLRTQPGLPARWLQQEYLKIASLVIRSSRICDYDRQKNLMINIVGSLSDPMVVWNVL